MLYDTYIYIYIGVRDSKNRQDVEKKIQAKRSVIGYFVIFLNK